jgi:hypothetical protein
MSDVTLHWNSVRNSGLKITNWIAKNFYKWGEICKKLPLVILLIYSFEASNYKSSKTKVDLTPSTSRALPSCITRRIRIFLALAMIEKMNNYFSITVEFQKNLKNTWIIGVPAIISTISRKTVKIKKIFWADNIFDSKYSKHWFKTSENFSILNRNF